jgi:hypothetical protein
VDHRLTLSTRSRRKLLQTLLALALFAQTYSGSATLDNFLGSEHEQTRFVDNARLDVYFDLCMAGAELALYDPGDENLYQSRSKLIKRYLQLDMGPIWARIGTFNAAFGRGIVLNATPDESVASDRFLDGITIGAEVGPLTARFLAGEPRNYLYYKLQDSTGIMRGVDVELSTLADVGFSYVYYEVPLVAGISIVRSLASLRLEKSLGALDLYLEGARKVDDPKSLLDFDFPGTALYGSASYSAQGFSVTGEYKFYDMFGYPFSVPPTVNKYGIYVNQGQDEEGFEVVVDVFPTDNLFLRGDFSMAWSSNSGPFAGGEMLEGFFEAVYYFPSLELTFDIDYLNMKNVTAIVPEQRIEINPHLQALIELPSDMALELGGRARRREDDEEVYTDYDFVLTLFKFPIVDVTGAYEFRCGDLEGEWKRISARVQVGGQYEVEATYGSQRQDLVCSGGVCRFEPEFNGVRLKVTLRF